MGRLPVGRPTVGLGYRPIPNIKGWTLEDVNAAP
jgi:hypothetical protein